MYWVYLILFTIIVFVPDIIREGVFGLGEEKSEELMIFILGSLGALFFILKEKQLTSNLKEKIKFQKKFNEISKDLNESYMYIGEMNRRLSIIKNISLKLAETHQFSEAKRNEICGSIKEALSILSKTNQFIIKFVDIKSKKTVKVVTGLDSQFVSSARRIKVNEKQESSVDIREGYIIVKSARDINGVASFVIMKISNKKIPENVELIQILATQALFLYTIGKKQMLTTQKK